MSRWIVFLASVLILAGCEEELTVPGQCPELCPGGQPIVLDTIVSATEGSDTASFGYADRSAVSSLLVSDGITAGEARAWVRFPRRSDSVTVGGIVHAYKVDSVLFTVNLVARDTLVHGLKLIFHRVPLTWDTVTAFTEVEAALRPEAIIDSIVVPDTLKTGSMRLLITDSTTIANLIPPADSGLLAVGFRIRASEPTGIRVGSVAGASGAASFATFVKADSVVDTTLRKQTLSVTAEDHFFVRNNDVVNPHPDLLHIGGIPSYRTSMRFVRPPIIKDSAARLVRATLELTPAAPLNGLRGDRSAVDIAGVTKDLGAKSPPAQGSAATGLIPEGGSTEMFG